MPLRPFKKKKKKDLPQPPSLTKSGGSMFDEVLGELRATRGAQPKESSKSTNFEEPLSPPPRKVVPQFNSEYNIPGPPKTPESSYPTPPGELQGPPRDSYSRRKVEDSRTVFGNEPASFKAEEVSDDILEELKMKGFRPDLVKAPPKRFVPKSTSDIKKLRLQETKREYLEAANKQLELGFFDNAATYIACAVLTILISDGLDEAKSSLSKLSSSIPSGVLDNVILDNVRLLLDSTRNRNFTFLTRAEKALKENMQQLYPEDIAIIESGIKTARSLFGLD